MKGEHRATRGEHRTPGPRVGLGCLLALMIAFAAVFIVAFLVALDPGTSCSQLGDWRVDDLKAWFAALWRSL